ncbi:MAG TPA: hypothetical protein VM513_35030, partial [Kofleriaceae bacterium]|nr:hypothetical protein [Kofleriaceae bacterium]
MDQAELDNLDERIRRAKAAIAERASLAARRPAIAAEHAEAAEICQHTAARVDKERADIDKAREGGVWSFLRGVVGDRDARIGKEVQEARAAEARHAEAVAYRDRLAAELAKLDGRIKALASAEAELEEARRAAHRAPRVRTASRGAELTRIAEQIGDLAATRREITEALAAGDGALAALHAMEGNLRAAREWGIADMGSGSLMVDEMKRDAIASAQSLVGTVQAELMLFQRELADVGRT